MTEAASAGAASEAADKEATEGTGPATTTAPTKVSFYAQYCFHLSPTLNQWCPMRIADIARLVQYAEFEGQNVFFHLNHPIKWVRIAGVVVEVNDYGYRRVYTVDDGSGGTVECVVTLPKAKKTGQGAAEPAAPTLPQIDLPGTVVNIKGELRTYRDDIQVHIVRMTVLRSTEQEVQFWAKIQAFAELTLYKPWVLDRQTVKECRKAAKEAQRAKDEEEIRKEVRREMQKEKEEKEKKEKEKRERKEREERGSGDEMDVDEDDYNYD